MNKAWAMNSCHRSTRGGAAERPTCSRWCLRLVPTSLTPSAQDLAALQAVERCAPREACCSMDDTPSAAISDYADLCSRADGEAFLHNRPFETSDRRVRRVASRR